MTSSTVSHTNYRIIAQGRLWFHFARILDASLPEQGSRLWVKPTLHAQYGLRQSRKLGARTFILTTRLDGGDQEALEALLQQQRHGHETLLTRRLKTGRLVLFAQGGCRLGTLNRAAWSWIEPLVEIGYEPAFFLYEITAQEGTLKAHVVISDFHQGVEAYLFEHYRQHAESVLC